MFFDLDGKTYRHRLGGFKTKKAAQEYADKDRVYWRKEPTFGGLIEKSKSFLSCLIV